MLGSKLGSWPCYGSARIRWSLGSGSASINLDPEQRLLVKQLEAIPPTKQPPISTPSHLSFLPFKVPPVSFHFASYCTIRKLPVCLRNMFTFLYIDNMLWLGIVIKVVLGIRIRKDPIVCKDPNPIKPFGFGSGSERTRIKFYIVKHVSKG